MPQRKCCVSSCTSALIDGAILHVFPNPVKREKFQIWVQNSGLVNEEDDYIYKNRRICHLHFDKIYNYPNNRLSPLAIPTLNLPGVSTSSRPAPTAIINDNEPRPSTSSFIGPMDIAQSASTSSRPAPTAIINEPQPSSSRVIGPRAISQSHQLRSKTEIELANIVAKTQAALSKVKRTKAGLVEKIKLLKKVSLSEAYKMVTKHLSPAGKTFFDMQIRQGKKHPKGRRFTLDEKILALTLYKPSPKAYRLLSSISVLPKKSTLNKLTRKIYLLPGINDVVFDHLKKRVQKMPLSHRYCTLIFDEMAIAANLSYDKFTDRVKGLCDDGTERKKCFTDHVLVFMVRGIFKKYKQPVSFTFCAGTTSTISLKRQIKEVINRLLETGLKVVSTTCDQGATNIAAINSLLRDTKQEYLRKEQTYKGGFFEVENEQIYPIFDPPHLIKGIRNNLLTKNLKYEINGKIYTAKWTHLEALYERGPGYRGVRLVPKLTARHVRPHLIPKMKVKYATQVFSKTVSVALGFTAGTGRIPRESTDTADILMFFDKLFDSVNGNFSKPIKGKVYRSAVTPKSPHHGLWYKSLPILKSMKFLGRQAGMVPSISSWIRTVEAFQHLTKKLQCLGLNSLLLRNFCQDPLENFFGAIRAHGQANTMPSATSFEASYKALLINNMASPTSVGANCESDDGFCLQTLKFFLTEDVAKPVSKSVEINFDHLYIQLQNIDTLLQSRSPMDIEKAAAAAYCGGWLIKLIYKHFSKNCTTCKQDLEGDCQESYAEFINLKKYSDKCIMNYPSKKMLEYFLQVEQITIEILQTNCEMTQLAEYIRLVATTLVSSNFLKCEIHGKKISKFILEKSVIFFINDWCKEITNIISGKTTVWDKSDPIKQLANSYNLKYKSKKRK